jgi:O-antigen ligase
MREEMCIPHADAASAKERAGDWLRALSGHADRAGFVLLVLTCVVLLLRPGELISGLSDVPVYETCIGLCILVSIPRLVSRPWGLRAGALITLTLLWVPTITVSHLANLNTWDARSGTIDAAKVCMLFVLTISMVRSPADLRVLLLAIAGSMLGMTMLAILSYQGLFTIPALAAVVQRDLMSEEGSSIRRLCGSGIFNDPNDYALILVLCMSVCTYGMGDKKLGQWRAVTWAAFALFAYALILTHSRGGMFSAAAAAGSYLAARFGWRNAVPVVLLGLGMLALLDSRQTDLNLSDPDDTFQARMDLWNATMDTFRAHPLIGIGQGKLVDQIGQVTHNSFLHAFAELGLVGGTIFIGVFYLGIRGLVCSRPVDPALARLRPCVLAIVVGYAAGMLALSRCYTAPVQLILGLTSSYLGLASAGGQVLVPSLSVRCIGRLGGIGIVFLGATYVFIHAMIHRSM